MPVLQSRSCCWLAGTFCALDIALRRLRALHPEDTTNAEEAVKVPISVKQ